jgi:hypothetical protein
LLSQRAQRSEAQRRLRQQQQQQNNNPSDSRRRNEVKEKPATPAAKYLQGRNGHKVLISTETVRQSASPFFLSHQRGLIRCACSTQQVVFKPVSTGQQLELVDSALPILFALAQNSSLYLVSRVPNDDAQRQG